MTSVLSATDRSTKIDGLHSAVYTGTVSHRRFGPGVAHDFSYRCTMPFIDLAEIDDVTALHPLWSSRHAAPGWFRRADFMGTPQLSLDECVRNAVEAHCGHRPRGRIALLANLRTWGWLFNPISLYFCQSADGTEVETLVLEVENTPWHERRIYVVGPPQEMHRFSKEMHVSPFLPMGVEYEVRYSAPAGRLIVHFDVMRGDERLFAATMSLRRRGMDRQALGRILWEHPLLTYKVSAGIYLQAARLRSKGAPFYNHPATGGRRHE